jgi:hypothetical protein
MTKWKIRQYALNTIGLALTSTATLAVLIVIKIAKYNAYGLALYGWPPPQSALADPGMYFFTTTLLPMLPWFVVTILADAFIVEPLVNKIL